MREDSQKPNIDSPFVDLNNPEHNVTIGQAEQAQHKLSPDATISLWRVMGFGTSGEMLDGATGGASDGCYPNQFGTANIADMYKFCQREHGNRAVAIQVKTHDVDKVAGKDSDWQWVSDILSQDDNG